MTAQDYEQLNHQLAESGWERVVFDGGQSHLMGWTVLSVWEWDKAKITLNHSERYNEVSFEIEANPLAVRWLKDHGWEHLFDF
jgi:hypothetical protein